MDRPLARPHLARAHYPLDWNAPARDGFLPFAAAQLEQPIARLFEAVAQRLPDRIAIDDGERKLTYGQARLEVRALAARIAAVTPPGAPVAALLAESADFPVALLACLAAGRLFLPLDLHYPAAWLRGMIADAKPSAIIAKEGTGADGLCPPQLPVILMDGPAAPEDYHLTPAGADEPALVIFTSGSTGKPKGIVNSQRALLRRVEQHMNGCHFTPDDGFMPLSSGCTIAGIRERLTALLAGATLYPVDVQRAGARNILDRLEQTGATAIYAVPALLRTLAGLQARAPQSLRLVRVGGDAVLWSDIDLLRRWLPHGCAIQVGYSSSEAPILQWIVGEDFPREGLRVPIGYPLAGGELAVVGEGGQPLAPGEIGELIVSSPYVALGHWRDGRLDRSPFPEAASDPACRVLATGDLVRLRDDGLLDIIGRKDRQIKINGIRVEPGEVEAAIRLDPGIADAAILPRRLGKQVSLIAYAVAAADAPAGLAVSLKTALKRTLPSHLQPRAIHLVAAIPRLPSGKLDMKGLERLDADHQLREAESAAQPGEGAAPAGETEEKIAALWRRLLGRERIARDLDFFDAGGDSLLTLDLMFALEQEFGRALPVTAIFEDPTVAGLAALVEHGAPPVFSPLVLLKDGEGAPLFIVHGVGGTVMELFALGRAMHHSGPVYALQAKGLDGTSSPLRRIEEQAEYYLTAIGERFEGTAYHLAGYSAGGLVAFEMAKQLRTAGHPALSLTLIDTQTHTSQWPLAVWLDFLLRRAHLHAGTLIESSWPKKAGVAFSMCRGLTRRILRRFLPAIAMPSPPAASPVIGAVYAANMEAICHYVPQGHPGPVTLIAARRRHPDIANTAGIWRSLSPGCTIRRAQGDHFSMLRGDNAAVLAALMDAALSSR